MSDFHPLVSIVIPVYNGANYMREAIDSALAQTYDNCEILVVNDGSRDDGETERIALSYGDEIRYFAKENGGVATALNLAIREMRGEYFSWLSHDDVYFPYKVERQIAFMDALELYDAVLYSDYAYIDASSRLRGEERLPGVLPDCFFQYLYLNPGMHGCTLLIPRSAFDEVGGFPEHLKTTQDYDLWLRMCRKRPFVHQAEILVQGRQHETQGSRVMPEHGPEIQAFFKDYLPELLETASTGKTPEEAKRQRLSLIPLLFAKGHGDIVKKFYAADAWGEEGQSVLALLADLSREERAQGIKPFIKRVLRPAWRLLPETAQRRIRRVKDIFTVRNQAVKAHEENTSVRRVDFTRCYLENGFGATESLSGGGSSLFQTRILRRELPGFFHRLGVRSILDIPCGDFHWMRHLDLGDIQYTGGDIVEALAERNQKLYGNERRSFMRLDAINGPLPRADVIFCRDCLVHLPFADCLAALRAFKASGATWLLTTTFCHREENKELIGTTWRVVNLCKPPFNFPEPEALLNEKCAESGGLFADKCLGLWKLTNLPV